MTKHTLAIDGVEAPAFFYGTAWKEEQTQHLTELAIECGFRGIDTANQRRHYDEAAVGRAVAASIAKGLVGRDDLFLQTKFTFRRGQDHRLPYDPRQLYRSRSNSRSPVHLHTWVLSKSIRICCTGRQARRGWSRTIGPRSPLNTYRVRLATH